MMITIVPNTMFTWIFDCLWRIFRVRYTSSISLILTWVGSFIFENLDEFIETGRDQCSEERTDPIDPMMTGEILGYYGRTE